METGRAKEAWVSSFGTSRKVAATFRKEFTAAFRNLSVHRPRREEGTTKRHGERIQFRGEISGRDEGERVNGGYRGSWNRGNEPDIDRIDRAYSPRLYVRLFAEK